MIEDLPALNPWEEKTGRRKGEDFHPPGRDAMDLWEYIKESFFKSLAPPVEDRERRNSLAIFPLPRHRQMELLQQAMEKTVPGRQRVDGVPVEDRGIDETGCIRSGEVWNTSPQRPPVPPARTWPRGLELPLRRCFSFSPTNGFVESPHCRERPTNTAPPAIFTRELRRLKSSIPGRRRCGCRHLACLPSPFHRVGLARPGGKGVSRKNHEARLTSGRAGKPFSA